MDAAAKDMEGHPAMRRTVYLTLADDIVPLLKLLRDHATDIELRLSGVDGRYTGRILDLSSKDFLLEDIRPRDGIKHLRRGTTFSFSARSDDVYVSGEDCRITRVESERGLPYYHAELPARMLRQRRRRHTRITLPPRVSPNDGVVRLSAHAGSEPLLGRIIDVSVGGCRIALDGPVDPPLELDQVLAQCDLRITSSFAISAGAVVRHASWDAARGITTCGLEFSEMSIGDRRRLEHYVMQLTGKVAARG